jgi:hypothetical protein
VCSTFAQVLLELHNASVLPQLLAIPPELHSGQDVHP